MGAFLVAGLILPMEHWFVYGRIDPTFGHEWVGWLLATISMIGLALIQKGEKKK